MAIINHGKWTILENSDVQTFLRMVVNDSLLLFLEEGALKSSGNKRDKGDKTCIMLCMNWTSEERKKQ